MSSDSIEPLVTLTEASPEHALPVKKHAFSRFLRILGPGLITGAADDDPSGIATYTQTGAQFGYGQLWTVLFMLPLMTAVQEACARIGAVSGKGIAAVIKEHYSKKILFPVIALVLVANTINIGADIGAMASAAHLIIPIPFAILTLAFTIFILLLEIFTSYKIYARILKWLALALLSYLFTMLIVAQPWGTILRATFIPHFELSFSFLFIITGVLGTTISPYMFFWQASEEVEEEREHHLLHRHGKPSLTKRFIKNLRIDTFVGMFVSSITTWSIIVVGATVLNAHGLTNVATAADAAKALEPLVGTFPNAGYLAKLIFAVGILGLGLLSIPVLSGSASYALSEAMNWKSGLNLKLKRAHGFYGVITIATLIGLIINFIGIDPVQALVFTAVFNGVAAVPLLFLIAKIAQSEKIMGEYKSGWLSKFLVWLTFSAMAAAAVTMFVVLSKGM
jgi:NRAMP (natural resistance-associated macrophage protein)-like metal ion transporter